MTLEKGNKVLQTELLWESSQPWNTYSGNKNLQQIKNKLLLLSKVRICKRFVSNLSQNVIRMMIEQKHGS